MRRKRVIDLDGAEPGGTQMTPSSSTTAPVVTPSKASPAPKRKTLILPVEPTELEDLSNPDRAAAVFSDSPFRTRSMSPPPPPATTSDGRGDSIFSADTRSGSSGSTGDTSDVFQRAQVRSPPPERVAQTEAARAPTSALASSVVLTRREVPADHARALAPRQGIPSAPSAAWPNGETERVAERQQSTTARVEARPAAAHQFSAEASAAQFEETTTPLAIGDELAATRPPRAQPSPSAAGTLGDKKTRERDNERERLLVKSVYDSERRYLDIRGDDKRRAARIEMARDALLLAPELKDRERALVAHQQAKATLVPPLVKGAGSPTPHGAGRVKRLDENDLGAVLDKVLALALVARQRTDEHLEDTRRKKDQLVVETLSCGVVSEGLVRQLVAFFQDEASLDAGFCRRQMHQALALQPDGVPAHVYALALHSFPHRAFSERRSTSVGFTSPLPAPAGSKPGGVVEELVGLRVQQALGTLTDVDIQRAEFLARETKECAGK